MRTNTIHQLAAAAAIAAAVGLVVGCDAAPAIAQSGPGAGADPTRATGGAAAGNGEQSPGAATRGSKPAAPSGPPARPRESITPSEKILADSVVAFPVDI